MAENTCPENSNRIQEILVELQECREDQRSNDTIIVQAITVAISILAIVGGASYLIYSQNKLNTPLFSQAHAESSNGFFKIAYSIFDNLTPAHLFLYITCVTICAVFGYISARGIRATMLCHYIQNLEDRLRSLIAHSADDEGRGQFIHFDDYISPIITLDAKHLSSSYSAWHYYSVMLSVICATACSIGFVLMQYLMISMHYWYDSFFFFLTISTISFSLIMYYRTTKNSRRIFQFSINTAHVNTEARVTSPESKQYPDAEQFLHRLRYFLFPRINEWYKCLIPVFGYISACYYYNIPFRFTEIALLVFLFEYLLYGARYQLNDIIGVREDQDSQNFRLSSIFDYQSGELPLQAINNSWNVMWVRIGAALICTIVFAYDKLRLLSIFYITLLILTILYEIIKDYRAKHNDERLDWLVYLTVGTGYPLRFLVGFLIANETLLLSDCRWHFVWFILSIYCFGIFSSLLAWGQRIQSYISEKTGDQAGCKKIEKATKAFARKPHFTRIIGILEQNLCNVTNCSTILGAPPEHRKQLFAPWNVFFFLSLIFSASAIFFSRESRPPEVFTLCIVVFLSLLFIISNQVATITLFSVSALLSVCIILFCAPLLKIYFIELLMIQSMYFYLRFFPSYSVKKRNGILHYIKTTFQPKTE